MSTNVNLSGTSTQNSGYVPPIAQPVLTKAEPSPTRPGYTTTEFWTGTVVPTIFLVLAQFNVLPDTNNPKLGGWIHLGSYLLAGLGYAFYAISRGHVKKGAAIALAIRSVIGGNMPDILNTFRTVAPKQTADISKLAEPIVAAIQAVDPEFSESQVEDISNIVRGMVTHPQTMAAYEKMLTPVVQDAVKNVLGNANSPDVALRTAQTVEAVEDVVKAGEAPTTDLNTPPLEDVTPVDTNTGDGASFTAPQFS
jgi:hypothetical protein